MSLWDDYKADAQFAHDFPKLPKIEDECHMADRMEKRLLKSLNDEIFDAFMKNATQSCSDYRKGDERR